MPERFQQEIEKILEQTEDLPPPSKSEKTPKEQNNPASDSSSSWKNSISPGRVIILGVLLLLTFAMIFNGTWQTLFLWGGLILGIAGYALFFVRADKASSKPHWRGKLVEYDENPSGPTWWDKLRKRFKS
ncbi:MAG: hypothetical protein FI703_00735 [SAR202 cluster bacterium]|nr:hypothetical protein [SAR202 cluster bacterium]|tara:strand:+ start:258 stop:647 length:390 start_codon:yes stop_codon:yes gene_type:complete